MKPVVLLAALAAVLLGVSPAFSAPSQPETWLGVWGASPTPPVLAATARSRVSATFDNQTVRQVVRVSAGGRKVRIRLSNEYGKAPLWIGAAHIAVAGEAGAVQPGSDRVLTFGGSPTAIIPAGAPIVSDPVDLNVAPLSHLAVSLYLPANTGPCTCHPVGVQTGYVSGPGDFSGAASFPAKESFTYRAFLSGVEVVPSAPTAAQIVVFGDSISDGTASTPDKNARWPDRLAERLAARDGGRRAWGIANEAISGNQVLADGTSTSGLARFDRDVLSVPNAVGGGARYLVVFLGINDIGVGLGNLAAGAPPRAGPKLAPADIIAGHRQMIARARAHGMKVYGVTLTPYEGAAYWSAEGEAVRQAVNAWIRTSGAYDAVIDFDAVWKDPAHPTQIKPGLGAPDHLHGSDLGYRTMGDAVDLGLFR